MAEGQERIYKAGGSTAMWHHYCEGSRENTIAFGKIFHIPEKWELEIPCDVGVDSGTGDDIYFEMFIEIKFCPFCGIHLSKEEAEKEEATQKAGPSKT